MVVWLLTGIVLIMEDHSIMAVAKNQETPPPSRLPSRESIKDLVLYYLAKQHHSLN